MRKFILILSQAKQAEGTTSTLTCSSTLNGPKTTTSNFENEKKLLKNLVHFARLGASRAWVEQRVALVSMSPENKSSKGMKTGDRSLPLLKKKNYMLWGVRREANVGASLG